MFKPDPKPQHKKKNLTSKEYNEAIKKRGNKFNAKKSSYDGYTYDSNMESNYAKELDIRLKIGEVEHWERQPLVELVVKGKLWRKYKLDFKVYYPSGKVEYVEVKGFPTRDWKQKWDLLLIIKDDVLEEGAILTLFTNKGTKHY